MSLRRRRKVLAWGTFCPTCRTVYRFPDPVPLFCCGWGQPTRHEDIVTTVVTVFR